MANTALKRVFLSSCAALLVGGGLVGAYALGTKADDRLALASLTDPVQPPMAPEKPQEAKPQDMAPSSHLIRQLSFADLVEEVSPAVVSIKTEGRARQMGGMLFGPDSGFDMLPEEFRRRFNFDLEQDEDGEAPLRPLGEGSGFFIDDQGHIVTNHHVIDDAEVITVVLADGDEIPATLVGSDPLTDIAVLKVAPSGQQRYVRFAPDTDLRVGDYVLAVGNPFGLGGSVTSGIVSAIGREDQTGRMPISSFIQIDASINRGNSGGPTFDLNGNVVGVNTAIISPTSGSVGIGLAVPADVANNVATQLINSGMVTRGWLGVSIGDIDEILAEAVGLDEPQGALVQSVQEDSPAARAGLEGGDVILSVDGQQIEASSDLQRVISGISPGSDVDLEILRGDRRQTLEATLAQRDSVALGEAPEERNVPAEREEAPPENDDLVMGVTFSALDDRSRSRLRLGENVEGVVITDVENNSKAAEAGLRNGMVITRADNRDVDGPRDLERIVESARNRGKDAVLVRVETAQSGAFFLALPIAATNEG